MTPTERQALEVLVEKWRGFSKGSYADAKLEMDDPEGGNLQAATRDQLAGDMWKQAADELSALLAASPTETGWLIEAKGPLYWDGLVFTPSHDCAVRFSRKADAQRVITVGLPALAPPSQAVEHLWCFPTGQEQEKER